MTQDQLKVIAEMLAMSQDVVREMQSMAAADGEEHWRESRSSRRLVAESAHLLKHLRSSFHSTLAEKYEKRA